MREIYDLEKIQEIQDQFDPENADHWTREGYPKLDMVMELADVKNLTRKDLTEMYPEWVRTPEPAELAEKIEDSNKSITALKDKLVEEYPPLSQAENHQRYVKSQQAERAKRNATAAQIAKETGLKVVGSAPVDNVPKK